MNNQREFSPSVVEKLGYYVYLLKDPETDQVFYVGKGTGNRVFQHLWEADVSSASYEKLDTIRAIREKNQEVKCLIHRHGLTEEEALEVETSLIDFIGLDDLANRVGGHGSNYRGQMNIEEVIARYNAPKITISERSLLIVVNRQYRRGINSDELYQITRKHWKIGRRRCKAEYAFAVYNGIVRQVYKIDAWHPSDAHPGRWLFDGTIATDKQNYVGGCVEDYLTQGAQNPIKYVNC